MPTSISSRFHIDTAVNDTAVNDTAVCEVSPPPETPIAHRYPLITETSDMGLSRHYPDQPTSLPDDQVTLPLKNLCPSSTTETVSPDPYAPFKNYSSFLLSAWANGGDNKKSDREIRRLSRGVINAAGFVNSDIKHFSLTGTNRLLDKSLDYRNDLMDGWKHETVKIRIPIEGKTHRSEARCPEVEIPGLYYRSLVDTIEEALGRDDASLIHYTPYKEYWKPSETSTSERVYGEAYSADAWMEAHEEIQASAPNDGVENVALPLMLWSDATHLAEFGSASIWPLYMYFAGHSKYIRAKPSSGVGHHLAYIPSVSVFKSKI